ncbi:hypothetical protein EBX93_09845 [bacterium]|nr:hypothetical protein [bacterium]
MIDNAREGKYSFQLLQPLKQEPAPFVDCMVLSPPGEMEKLTMQKVLYQTKCLMTILIVKMKS